MGIEPTSSAWKAEVLPLNYTRRRPPPRDMGSYAAFPPLAFPPSKQSHLVEGVGFEPT